jgi:hypothetical protein
VPSHKERATNPVVCVYDSLIRRVQLHFFCSGPNQMFTIRLSNARFVGFMSSRGNVAMAAWWRRQQPGRAARRVVAEGGIGTTVGGCGMHCGEQQPLIRVLDRFTVSAEHQWAST